MYFAIQEIESMRNIVIIKLRSAVDFAQVPINGRGGKSDFGHVTKPLSVHYCYPKLPGVRKLSAFFAERGPIVHLFLFAEGSRGK